MKYSKLFGKTIKEAPKDATLPSHKLLYQGGFIRESTAGRYYLLPLGLRVQQNLQHVIKEAMDQAGAQEMVTPVLHPIELWQETNRISSVSFELMKIKDRNEMEFVLGGTAEEMLVDVVRKFQISYKDLPFNMYQFSTKFRDELRARGGLLRLREFVMKDSYSFHASEEDFKKEYESMKQTYTAIFEKLGLKTLIVESDNGYIGGEYCHEFIVESEAGESKFLMTEDGSYAAHEDVARFQLEAVNPDEKSQEMTIVDQPQDVRTMDEFMKHYGKDKQYFLKNVVYKNYQGDIIIATIRGDLEVNKIKLGHLLEEVVELTDATADDLTAIGTKTGYVHSWGHTFVTPRRAKTEDRDAKVIYVADASLKTVRNFIGGQKEEKTDSINVNYGRDFKHDVEGDIALAKEGLLGLNGQRLIAKKGVEVGNIFQLGFHYSTKMRDASFTDADGRKRPYYMGCYGIGLARTLATVVEKYHDAKGIVWPEILAPYQVHLISIKYEVESVKEKAEEIYKKLLAAGVTVLFDDREGLSAGAKFADADLLGMPIRLVVSERTLQQDSAQAGDNVEWKKRNEEKSEVISIEEVLERLKK